jgi:hypothetical protein
MIMTCAEVEPNRALVTRFESEPNSRGSDEHTADIRIAS